MAGGKIPFFAATSRSNELSNTGSCNSQDMAHKQMMMIDFLIQSNIKPQFRCFQVRIKSDIKPCIFIIAYVFDWI